MLVIDARHLHGTDCHHLHLPGARGHTHFKMLESQPTLGTFTLFILRPLYLLPSQKRAPSHQDKPFITSARFFFRRSRRPPDRARALSKTQGRQILSFSRAGRLHFSTQRLRPMAPTTRTERLAAALLAKAAASPGRSDDADGEDDAHFMQRKAAVSALAHARLNALRSRLNALIPALERRLRAAAPEGATAAGDGDVAWTDEPALTAAQMLEKLAFVAEAAAQELEADDEQDGDEQDEAETVDWSSLLAVVMGSGEDGEALSLCEGDEAARHMDDALDARLEQAIKSETSADGVLEALKDSVTHHLRAVLVVPVSERGASSAPPRDASRHSLWQLLREFRGVFTTCYEPFLSLPGRNAASRGDPDADTTASSDSWALRVACALPLAAADVIRFAGLLTQVLRAKHPLLRLEEQPEVDGKATDLVRCLVVDALFDALQRTLHELLTAVFRREDTFVGDVAYLSRASAPAAFGVREALRLDGSWSFGDDDEPSAALEQLAIDADDGGDRGLETEEHALERRRRHAALREYGSALFWLDSMSTSSRAPSEKLRRLVRACREARGAGALYYMKEWGARCRQRGWDVVPESGGDPETYPTPEELEMCVDRDGNPYPLTPLTRVCVCSAVSMRRSPADMHALLGFMLSAAPSTNTHVFSQLAILRVFEPLASAADDDQSDAVASLSGAVQRMMPSP